MSGYNIVLKKSLPNSKNIVHRGEYDFTHSYRMLRLKSTRVSFSYFLDKFWAFSMVLFNRLQMHLLNTKAGGEISWRGALIKLLHQMSITSNESNRQPFGSQAGTQSPETHQPQLNCFWRSWKVFYDRPGTQQAANWCWLDGWTCPPECLRCPPLYPCNDSDSHRLLNCVPGPTTQS